jgi:hypothetical protein
MSSWNSSKKQIHLGSQSYRRDEAISFSECTFAVTIRLLQKQPGDCDRIGFSFQFNIEKSINERGWSEGYHRYSLNFTEFVSVTFKRKKYPQSTFERELTNPNKPFNYQASPNPDIVYFISQDWPNRFRCDFE